MDGESIETPETGMTSDVDAPASPENMNPVSESPAPMPPHADDAATEPGIVSGTESQGPVENPDDLPAPNPDDLPAPTPGDAIISDNQNVPVEDKLDDTGSLTDSSSHPIDEIPQSVVTQHSHINEIPVVDATPYSIEETPAGTNATRYYDSYDSEATLFVDARKKVLFRKNNFKPLAHYIALGFLVLGIAAIIAVGIYIGVVVKKSPDTSDVNTKMGDDRRAPGESKNMMTTTQMEETVTSMAVSMTTKASAAPTVEMLADTSATSIGSHMAKTENTKTSESGVATSGEMEAPMTSDQPSDGYATTLVQYQTTHA